MKKVISIIEKLDLFISSISLIIIISITVAGVIARKFLGTPIAWLEEIQLFFFVWTVFFAGSVAFRTGNHVGIDIVAERLNPKARKVLDVIVYIITMLVILYLFKGSLELLSAVTKKVTPYFKISYVYIDAAAPIGCVLMMLQYTILIYRRLTGKEVKEEE